MTTFVATKETAHWAKIVGKQIEESIKTSYGAAWRHFGPELRFDILEGKIMGIMLNVERFSRGDLADGEFEGRTVAVRAAIAHLNPEA